MNTTNLVLQLLLAFLSVIAVVTQIALQRRSKSHVPPAVESVRRIKIAGWMTAGILAFASAWGTLSPNPGEVPHFSLLILLPALLLGFAQVLGSLLRLCGTYASYHLKYRQRTGSMCSDAGYIDQRNPNLYGRRLTDMLHRPDANRVNGIH